MCAVLGGNVGEFDFFHFGVEFIDNVKKKKLRRQWCYCVMGEGCNGKKKEEAMNRGG